MIRQALHSYRLHRLLSRKIKWSAPTSGSLDTCHWSSRSSGSVTYIPSKSKSSVTRTNPLTSCVSILNKVKQKDVVNRFYTTECKISSLYKEKGNIILMGSPGSGKTTVGRLLSERLDKSVLDVDNDFLEQHWGVSVADKLSELGSEGFLEAEGLALMELDVCDTIVSLTGSNPMHTAAIESFKRSGLVVYLDVIDTDILKRLEKMKVKRIVGQEAGVPMTEILPYRQQFYEAQYDVRILCEPFESAEDIAERVHHTLNRLERPTGYVSTREDIAEAKSRTFNEAVLEGLAWDGGLYVPEAEFPYFTERQWSRLIPLSYTERALRILEKWIHPLHLHPSVLKDMVDRSYTAESFGSDKIFPIEKLSLEKTYSSDQYILELFHGPTASFKDGALQLMPKFFQHAMLEESSKTGEKYMIVVATSGDTGGAVLDGFSKLQGESGVRVMVLYPEDGISLIQKAQMTNVEGDNVRVIGVKSDFDFCQTAIKQIFNNADLNDQMSQEFNYKLSAANSINWGRLLPQIVYHASGYLDLVQRGRVLLGQPVDLCVPTGNFGNILAAYYAQAMGIPFRRLICASNSNNVLTEFFNTGRYNMIGRSLHLTASPAIDILKSSNLERFLYHVTYDNAAKVKGYYDKLDQEQYFTVEKSDLRNIKSIIRADWCVESSCLSCIAKTYKKTGYLLDPHTAVAKVIADKYSDDEIPMVIASTAHPDKFAGDVLNSLGHSLDGSTPPAELFQRLQELEKRPRSHENLKRGVLKDRQHHRVIEADVQQIVREIKEFAAA